MRDFVQLLRSNRNYRYTWMGQVVSEIGDHFNNVAVFALGLALTKSGMVVTGIMLARAIPAMTVGPMAGVVLDRFDRKRIMIASDLLRAVFALGFILAIDHQRQYRHVVKPVADLAHHLAHPGVAIVAVPAQKAPQAGH